MLSPQLSFAAHLRAQSDAVHAERKNDDDDKFGTSGNDDDDKAQVMWFAM